MYTRTQLKDMVIDLHPYVRFAILHATDANKVKMRKKLFQIVPPCIDEINDLTEESIMTAQRILMGIFKREKWL